MNFSFNLYFQKGKEKKAVTFAVDIHNTTETHLSLEDLDPVEKKLEVISIGIKVNKKMFVSLLISC